MLRILHIVGSLERAGIETFLMNIYRNIDRERIQFDFAIYNMPSKYSYAKEVEQLGGKIYIVPSKNKGFIRCLSAISRIVSENNYDIIWRDCSSCVGGIDLLAAWGGGAKVRILHSHSSNKFGTEKYLHYLLRPICNLVATRRFACGQRAAKWMFGNRGYELIPNGIDTEQFKFDKKVRDEYRSKFGLEGKNVIGTIGRFQKVKNHLFLISVFNTYLEKDSEAVLCLVGSGEMEDACKAKTVEYGIENKVLFLGTRSDIPQILQMFDVFVMTSIYEGFPVTMIEAQAAGLPCVVSDSISEETNLTGAVEYVSLNGSISKWCEAIDAKIGTRVIDAPEILKEKGYDISAIVNKVEKLIY